MLLLYNISEDATRWECSLHRTRRQDMRCRYFMWKTTKKNTDKLVMLEKIITKVKKIEKTKMMLMVM
jgi:hypothetical protein